MSCDVGHRHILDPMMLWLWHRLAATAPTGSLTWDPVYAVGAALKRQKKKILNIELLCDLAIPLLGIYLDETFIQKYTCTPMFIAALVITAKT